MKSIEEKIVRLFFEQLQNIENESSKGLFEEGKPQFEEIGSFVLNTCKKLLINNYEERGKVSYEKFVRKKSKLEFIEIFGNKNIPRKTGDDLLSRTKIEKCITHDASAFQRLHEIYKEERSFSGTQKQTKNTLALFLGFTTWDELKAYVENISNSDEKRYFELFSGNSDKLFSKELQTKRNKSSANNLGLEDVKESENSHEKSSFQIKRGSEITAEELLGIRARKEHGYREDYYYKRSYLDEKISKYISLGKNILISGKPLAGKTRAVYETIKHKFPEKKCIVISNKNWEGLFKKEFVLPKNKNRIIFIFDDIDDYFSIENFVRYFYEIVKKSEQYCIIATCRTNQKNNWRENEKELLTDFENIEVLPLEPKQKEEIQLSSGSKLSSDDTIGSFFIDLIAMQDRYIKLNLVSKEILRSIKCLRYIQRIGEITEEMVLDYTSKRMKLSSADWDEALIKLSNQGFINIIEKLIQTEDIYLLKFIHLTKKDRAIEELIEFYPNINVFNKLIYHCSPTFDCALDFIKKMKKLNINYNEKTFIGLMHNASKEFEIKRVLKILKNEKINTSREILYEIVIKNEIDELFVLFKNQVDSKFWFQLGRAYTIHYYDDNRNKKAELCYKQAIKLDKNYASPWNNIGVLYMNKNNKKALKYFKKAYSLNPCGKTASLIGMSYLELGKTDDAIKYFCKCTAIFNYSGGYTMLGWMYKNTGKYRNAIYCFSKCSLAEPRKSYTNSIEICYCYLGLKNIQKVKDIITNLEYIKHFEYYRYRILGHIHLIESNELEASNNYKLSYIKHRENHNLITDGDAKSTLLYDSKNLEKYGIRKDKYSEIIDQINN